MLYTYSLLAFHYFHMTFAEACGLFGSEFLQPAKATALLSGPFFSSGNSLPKCWTNCGSRPQESIR